MSWEPGPGVVELPDPRQLGGVAAGEATAWVRAHYHPHAVETPWQRRYVRRFTPL